MSDTEQAYHVSDLTGDQKPDPLGDSSLTPLERVQGGKQDEPAKQDGREGEPQTTPADENG